MKDAGSPPSAPSAAAAAGRGEKGSRFLRAAPYLLAAGFIAAICRFFVPVMYWDDWLHYYHGIKILETPGWHWSPLFIRHHSAVPFLPRLLYLASLKFFHGDLRWLIGANVLTVLLTAFLLVRGLQRRVREKSWQDLLAAYGALTAFSSVQWFILFSGWGFMWLVIPGLLAAALLVHASRLSFPAAFAAYFLLAAAGSLSMADGLLLWIVFPLLLGDAFGWKPAGRGAAVGWAALWAAGMGGLVYLHVCRYDSGLAASYVTQVDFGSPLSSLFRPLDLVVFFLGVLGGIAGQIVPSLPLAAALGGVFLASFLVSAYLHLQVQAPARARRRQTGVLPWLAFGFFHLLAAAMIALARTRMEFFLHGNDTIENALSPQYVSISLYFLLSLVVSAYLCTRPASASFPGASIPGYRSCRNFLMGAALAGVLVHAAAFVVCCKKIVRESDFRHYYRAMLALQDSIPIAALDSEHGFYGLLKPAPRAKLVAYGTLQLVSPQAFESMLQAGRRRAEAGQWSGRILAEARKTAGEVQIQGVVAGAGWGERPDAVLAEWQLPGEEPVYRLFPLYASPLEALGMAEGRWRGRWTGGFPIGAGQDVSGAVLTAYAFLLDRQTLLPLLPLPPFAPPGKGP